MSLGTHTGTVSDVHTSPAAAAQQDDAHEVNHGPVSADLNDTMMTTVVSNGNDALNLLFEAAQREERGVNGVRVPVAADQDANNATTTPLSSLANLRSSAFPELSSELTETWNAYRFVRMGWLSAEEIVWFLDMYGCSSHFPKVIMLTQNLGSLRILHPFVPFWMSVSTSPSIVSHFRET